MRWWAPTLLALVLACSQADRGGLLCDFEAESELDQFCWRCGQLFSLSGEHATHGRRALRLWMAPARHTGLLSGVARRDWSGFRALCLDVYNPQPQPLQLTVRIDDRPWRPPYCDRYERPFSLAPGPNLVRIPLETLVTSGTGRPLELSNIWLFYLYLHLESPTVLYLDYLRLE